MKQQLKYTIMKTTIKFPKGITDIQVTTKEIMAHTSSKKLLEYLDQIIKYEAFRSQQTKRGQARKNERARKWRSMFAEFDQEKMSSKHCKLANKLEAKKYDALNKVAIEIDYDGRQRSNLSQIIRGVKMAYFTGAISSQYHTLGLRSYELVEDTTKIRLALKS